MRELSVLVVLLVLAGVIIKYWWVFVIALAVYIGYEVYKRQQRNQRISPKRPETKAAPPSAWRPATPLTATRPPQAKKPTTPAPKPTPPHKLEPVRTPKAQPPHPPHVIVHVIDTPEEDEPASWVPALPYANLTRKVTAWPASEAIYTAIDFETTGLDAQADRIVEVGLVKFTAEGTIIDEFATLVNNPGSSAGARSAHQIDDADLIDAPATADALREAFAFMAGTVVVAHNWEFEEGFLVTVARRTGLRVPNILAACTMKTAQRQMDGRAYSLKVMYKSATGEFLENSHNALADARAVGEILPWMLRTAPKPLYLTAGPPQPALPPYAGGNCPIKCRPAPIGRASMSALIEAFPQSPNHRAEDPTEVESYLALLSECLEDGRLTYEETRAMTEQVQRTRLTGTQIRDLHREAWQTIFPGDWVGLSPVERREAYLLADALGLPDLAKQLEEVIDEHAEPKPDPTARYLRGLRIGIAGDTTEFTELRQRAEGYGAKIAINITKTVQWMATTTPEATDSRHNSARKFGIPMVTPAEGGKRLDEAVRDAELKAFERQKEIDEMEAERQSYRNEQDAYWRPMWRTKELDCDPQREYDWY